MRSVRVFYKKKNRLKFISHLDTVRFMSRLISKAKIPVWYTEGFNQHMYLNFALPLSLGFESEYEILELRITDDGFSDSDCLKALKSASPEDIEFFKASEPLMSIKEIGFSDFSLTLPDSANDKLAEFLAKDSILCEKKSKKGIKEIDLIPKIKKSSINGNLLNLRLVAGVEDNLNPTLIMDTFFSQTGTEPFYYKVMRTAVLSKDEELFI